MCQALRLIYKVESQRSKVKAKSYYFSHCPAALNSNFTKEIIMDHNLTTTTFEIGGYRIVKQLGVVRGIVVRSRSLLGTIGGSLQTLFGGNITLFSQLCEKTRGEAFDMMVEHAEELGANAVIGVRYDATELMSGVSEVLCYGTAVVVSRV